MSQSAPSELSKSEERLLNSIPAPPAERRWRGWEMLGVQLPREGGGCGCSSCSACGSCSSCDRLASASGDGDG